MTLFAGLAAEVVIAQLRDESNMWAEMLKDMLAHPSLKTPLIMICGWPWWIWLDEVRGPVEFYWVEDRLTLPKKRTKKKSASRSRRS